MSSSAMSGKKKNFQKWRSKNSSDSEKPQESKVKVIIEPFELTFKQRAKYSQWKSAFTDQAKYEFGLLGQMCELEEYPDHIKVIAIHDV